MARDGAREVGFALFQFPGDPAWSATRRALEMRYGWRGEWAVARIAGPALEALAGRDASPADALRAAFLARAQLEHAIEQKVRRLSLRGAVELTAAEVRAAIASA